MLKKLFENKLFKSEETKHAVRLSGSIVDYHKEQQELADELTDLILEAETANDAETVKELMPRLEAALSAASISEKVQSQLNSRRLAYNSARFERLKAARQTQTQFEQDALVLAHRRAGAKTGLSPERSDGLRDKEYNKQVYQELEATLCLSPEELNLCLDKEVYSQGKRSHPFY